MNPIKLYFVGSKVKSDVFERIENVLCSYLAQGELKGWINFVGRRSLNFIIDSGAYSAWTSGRKINLYQYINFCKYISTDKVYSHHKIRFVNLDIIPGRKGQPTTKDEIEKAASKGFENLKIFIDKGIIPIHVFHQGEDFRWIDRIVEKTDYLGISPRKDLSIKDRKRWIDHVFSYLYKNNYKVKIHGFGVFIVKTLLDYPWTSIDSTVCHMLAGRGSIFYPKGGFNNPDYSKKPYIIHISKEQLNKSRLPFLKDIEKITKNDGYLFEKLKTSKTYRVIINTHYYTELEIGLNGLKKKMTYKPTIKLME